MFVNQKSASVALFCALFVLTGIYCKPVFADPTSLDLPEKVSLTDSNFVGDVDADAKSLSVTGSNSTIKVSGVPTDLTVKGSNNKVNIPAGCLLLNLTGSNNSLRLSKVSKITIVGSNNTVYWRTSVPGESPSISNRGANNEVTKVGSETTSRRITPSQKAKTQISKIAKGSTIATSNSQRNSVSTKRQRLSARSQTGSSIDSVDIGPDGVKIKSARLGN
jgi:hypothetical protein